MLKSWTLALSLSCLAAINAPAQQGSLDLEQALSQARKMTAESRPVLIAAAERPPADGVEVFVRLTAAEVARLRDIAETTRTKRKVILRMGEGSVWHRIWVGFDSHDDDAQIGTIELSVRKFSLLWLHDRRIDFRISPRTATAMAAVHYYSSTCRFTCLETSEKLPGLDMRTKEVRTWFREELDFWIAEKR